VLFLDLVKLRTVIFFFFEVRSASSFVDLGRGGYRSALRDQERANADEIRIWGKNSGASP
jgi:hypothetical protein